MKRTLPLILAILSLAAHYCRAAGQSNPNPQAGTNAGNAALAGSESSQSNIHISGIDARWGNYGQYLQKIIDGIQGQFENLDFYYPKKRSRLPVGSKTSIKFRIDSEGRIPEIIGTGGNAGDEARKICIFAITGRAPHGKWTDDMIASLGKSQEMTFTFTHGAPQARKADRKKRASKVNEIFYSDKPTPRGIFKAPEWPIEMKRQGITGEVVVLFVVGTKGEVIHATVIESTNRAFNEPSLEAVYKTKFRPGRINGKVVNTRMEIPILFSLTEV